MKEPIQLCISVYESQETETMQCTIQQKLLIWKH